MKADKLNQVLRQSVKNSKEKNYHGGLENAYPLPEVNNRILEIIKEDGLFAYDFEESKQGDEEEIKKMLFRRYNVAALCMSINPKLSPGQLSYLIDMHKNFETDLELYL